MYPYGTRPGFDFLNRSLIEFLGVLFAKDRSNKSTANILRLYAKHAYYLHKKCAIIIIFFFFIHELLILINLLASSFSVRTLRSQEYCIIQVLLLIYLSTFLCIMFSLCSWPF